MEQGTLHLNSDTARFLGYYLAEGSLLQHASSDVPSNIVCMTLHIDEETTIAKDVCEIAARNVDGYFRDPRPINGVQGNRVHISRCDNPEYKRPMQAIELVIYITKQFVETIVNDCGRGSHDKCFSKNLLNVDNDTATQILTGLFLGDGTVNNHKRIRWASVSRILVFQVSMLLNRLRIRHNVTNMVDAWGIDICPGDSTRTVFDWLAPYYRDWQLERRDTRNEQACRNLDEGQLRSLHEYRKVQYNGTVWDLSVDEDMSFVVNGIAVANCPDYRYRFAWANKQRGSGVVGPNSLNQAWNRAPRITNPTGRPALCKHLLALADSIFGWMVEFRGNPEGGTINVGLDRLTKRMQRRWVNFGDDVKRARERNSRISQDRAARQVGNNPYNTYNRMTGTTIPNADDLIEPPEGPDQTTTEQ